ncbi:hypothetical protein PENPOL_c010G03335 [Penicillium polonicum]|uniref:Proline dehydrogenase n=1 Tax=Penicillium polonicum TaxID=60169 RepID=A0A1V6NEV8_PENPO|nr:hypothetical protein PENPOL_c010G03335 [Penicillium polonicum]
MSTALLKPAMHFMKLVANPNAFIFSPDRKYTGAGRIAVDACLAGQALPPKSIELAMDEICNEARSQGSRIWIDAEQTHLQPTLDQWAINLMKRHNRDGKALVYNTIQAYLKSSRENVLNHLRAAQNGDWTLGIKLVRGAYIANEPRSRIHDTKEHTDEAYNKIVSSLLRQEFPVDGDHGVFPNVQLFVASHNVSSIRQAYSLHSRRVRDEMPTVHVEYGQLMGMADDVSCELLIHQREDLQSTDEKTRLSAPKVFKCLSWGSTSELVQNLYRRAVENTDAVQRTENMAKALRGELLRRVFRLSS